MICPRTDAATKQFGLFGRNLRAGAYTIRLHPLYRRGQMSWRASAYVKVLTHHSDGTKLTAREKLILLVLAESHNEERGNCAWIGIEKAAQYSLTSRSRFIELLGRLERFGTISVERREGKSSLYRFPDLPVRESDPPKKTPVRESDPTRPIAAVPHPSDSCRTQAFNEPIGTDIAPRSALLPPLLSDEMQQIRSDYHARRWKTDDEGKRYLISPSTGQRIYDPV